jgi:hypothetical protein
MTQGWTFYVVRWTFYVVRFTWYVVRFVLTYNVKRITYNLFCIDLTYDAGLDVVRFVLT